MAANQLVKPVEVVRGYYDRIDGVVLFLLIVMIALLCFAGFLGQRVGYAVIVAVACALSGGLLGFLFAVPKRKRDLTAAPVAAISTAGAGPQAGPEQQANWSASQVAQYESNTSLEEISDWLTKIIVGVGLVQAQEIGEALVAGGRAVGTGVFALPADGPAGLTVGIGTIIAFAVLGFMASFLWFRQNLMRAWSRTDAQCAVSSSRLAEASPDRVQMQTEPVPPGEMPAEPSVADLPGGAGPDALGLLAQRIREKYAELRTSAKHPDDWVKGMFGAASTHSDPNRMLSATIRPVKGDEFFEVCLTVTSQPAVASDVAFFLHNTFSPATQVIPADASGRASLTLYAWGAFTVGVLMDDGRTELELDLSQLPDAPMAFRTR